MPVPTEAENNTLLSAVFRQIKVPQLDWAAVGNELNITPRAAKERFDRLLKMAGAKPGKGGSTTPRKAATLATGSKTTGTPVKRTSAIGRKRKVADSSREEAGDELQLEPDNDEEMDVRPTAKKRSVIAQKTMRGEMRYEQRGEVGSEDGEGYETAEEGEHIGRKKSSLAVKKSIFEHPTGSDSGYQGKYTSSRREAGSEQTSIKEADQVDGEYEENHVMMEYNEFYESHGE